MMIILTKITLKFTVFNGKYGTSIICFAATNSSVRTVQDLRTGGRWFDPQYSLRGLLIVIATVLIPL